MNCKAGFREVNGRCFRAPTAAQESKLWAIPLTVTQAYQENQGTQLLAIERQPGGYGIIKLSTYAGRYKKTGFYGVFDTEKDAEDILFAEMDKWARREGPFTVVK
jgi:hypothetical protein